MSQKGLPRVSTDILVRRHRLKPPEIESHKTACVECGRTFDLRDPMQRDDAQYGRCKPIQPPPLYVEVQGFEGTRNYIVRVT